MRDTEYLMGIDIGTTAVKGSAYTVDGQCLFSAGRAYDNLATVEPGWVEQDPRQWVTAIGSIAEEAHNQLAPARCIGIGLTSQVNTHVFVDASGNALMPAITWQDQRCTESAEIVDAKIDDTMRAALWDENFHIDATNLLSRAHWVKSMRPEIWENTRFVFSPKDYCLFQLTGVAAADAISSIGLVDSTGMYLLPALSLVESLPDRMPPLHAITEVLGHTHSGFALSDCPVTLGVMDAWASLYGSGAVRHGDVFQIAGTSEIIGAHSNDAFAAPGVVTFPPIPGWYLHAGPTQLGGDAANWFADFMEIDLAMVFKLAAGAKNHREPLLFLPHLMGERAPIWDTKAKGIFVGLTRGHTRSDFAYAVLEGVAHAARLLASRVEIAAGYSIDVIRLSGGASRSDLWCQIKANVMNCRLQRLRNRDTGTFGAALLAGVGLNVYPDVFNAAADAVQIEREFEPQDALRDRCDLMHDAYLETYEAMKMVSHRFHDFARRTK